MTMAATGHDMVVERGGGRCCGVPVVEGRGVAVELKWNSRFKIGGLKSMIREEIF